MRVSDYIVEFLSDHGVEDVFLLEGSACASLIVSVGLHPKMKYWCPRHEQGGAFSVDGYYKASKKLTAMFATSGPGAQNLINGIAASWYDSIPALYITGNINSRFKKPSDEIRQHGFQESNIVTMVDSVTKWAYQITRARDIRYVLEKAMYMAKSGRPGPVLLDIPMDIQKEEIDPDKLMGYRSPEIDISCDYNIDGVIDLINKSERPVLLLGGGVWLSDSIEQARRLILKLKIPYYVTWNMIDFGSYEDPYYAGRVGTFGGDGRNFGIQNCDLLITIGSRISGRITGGMIDTFARGAKKIIVDIDQEELRWQQVQGDLNIVADAYEFCLTLGEYCDSIEKDFSGWTRKCIDWRDKYRVYKLEYANQKENVNPYHFIHCLSKVLPSDSIIVHDAGGNTVITSQGIESKVGQRIFSNNGNSSLGYSLPAAIGSAIATKGGRPVICIIGDGGMQFNIQELETIKHYNLPIKIFIFNNDCFGITKAFRDTNFNSNYAGVDREHGQSNPNFCSISKAYGIESISIDDHEDLEQKLEQLLKMDGPLLIDVNMKGFYNYHPKLGWRQPIEDQYPFIDRLEFESNMIVEPHPSWETPQYP